MEPSTSPANKTLIENAGVGFLPLSFSGNNGSFLKNASPSSGVYPSITASDQPSSLFSNPPLYTRNNSSQPQPPPAPTTNSNNNYTQALFATPSSLSSTNSVPASTYSIPLTPVKVNEVKPNKSRPPPSRSPITYTSVTPVSQNNAAQISTRSNSGSGADSNERVWR